jgi:hypothetical protein
MATRTDIHNALGQIDAEIAEVERTLEELRLQRRGAEALLARLPKLDRSASTVTAARRSSGGNAEIVVDVLANAPEGLDLGAIEAAATEAGHPLDNEQVRSAVAYLRRRGDVERVRRGVWRLLISTNAESAETPALSVLPTPPSEGVVSGTG